MASIVFALILTKKRLDTVISAYLLAFGVSYVLYYISLLLFGLVFMPFLSVGHEVGTPIDFNQPPFLLGYTLVVVFQFFLAVLLFRIRRFRNGFPFLFKRYAVAVALISVGAILAFVTGVQVITVAEDAYAIYLLAFGILIIGIGIHIWIRRGISMFQWKNIMIRNVELLEEAVATEKEKNRLLTEKLEAASAANHKMQRRFESLERIVARQTANVEIIEGFVTIDDVKKLHKEYQADLGRVKGEKPLPSTKIKELDYMFEHYAAKYANANIEFKLKVNGSIPYMVENVIDQSKLETMVGDHLQNALIAVNASDNSFRNVFVGIGLTGDCYELMVSDSGIPFEVNILTRLGSECVTTYSTEGGSGIGFMTTFETLQEIGASLTIHEKQPSTADDTKSIKIRFDGKGQYIIETYRSDEFPPSDRYKVIAHDK
jgi:hypothetical protein